MTFNHIKAGDVVARATQLAHQMDELRKEMHTMSEDVVRVPDMSEVFVMTRQVRDLFDASLKEITKLRDGISYKTLPEMMEDEGLSSFTTDTGYRVSVARRFSASFLDKEAGFDWLRDNDLGDIIKETVPSQTLSAQIREMIESEGMEPPDDIIKTSVAPYTSVTKVKK